MYLSHDAANEVTVTDDDVPTALPATMLAVCVKAIIYSSFAFKVSGAFSSCLSLSYFLLCLSPLFASLS